MRSRLCALDSDPTEADNSSRHAAHALKVIGYALENNPQVKPVPLGGRLPHVLQRAGLIDINGHDSPHSPTQRTTLIHRSHRRDGLLGLLDTANRTGPRKSPRMSSPTSRCDKSVTTRPVAVITGRPAPPGGKPCQRLVSGCERDGRPPSTDVGVTTRRELVAAIRASDSGQNTQVKAGFLPGKDAAIPGRR